MKSKTRLESAVFQLTPTRTRCDLYIIANGKKEKIASGLLNPFIAHLKAAQDQIAEGGYSVLLAPEANSNATWFTKGTVESFVRFVSTPEILERVVTIESEIIQIEEAISIQGKNGILIKDQYVKLEASNEGKNPARAVDGEEMAIVLYKHGAHELTDSSAKKRNSKVQLIDVLETRKTVLKKEQGMAFARAVAAGFDIEHVANLLSFAKCFGASRLMSGCLGFMDLWRKKHESGQWVEIEAEEAILNSSTSGIVMTNEPSTKARGSDVISVTTGSNANATGVEQQYHEGQPPWVMHSSPQGGVPVYPVPYYQHYPGFYPPPPPPPYPSFIEEPCHFQKRQSMDSNNMYNNTESEAAGKKKSDRVVIHNINFKIHTSSEDTDDHTQQKEKRNLRSPKRKGNHKETESETTRSGKETDCNGHWDAFQTYLLKSAAEGDMFAMEKDRRQKTMADYDPLLAHAKHNDDHMQTSGLKMFETNSNKTVPVVKYEPDALSLMPERDVENSRYDPAINYEMQLAAAASQDKKGSKIAPARKRQPSKPNLGVVNKGRPSKVNNIYNNKKTLEDARARADKLRSYKADLQKMKKEQQDAEQKRLEALKMERQKRISAKKQLPASSKFTDSEPNSSSPLQRSKMRPSSINNSKTTSKLVDRMTRSLSDTKNEMSSVTTTSLTRIRRLSEPKKINTPHNTKLRSAEPISKPKSSSEIKKISAISDQSKAADLKITSSSNPISSKMKVKETTSQVAKVNSNNSVNRVVDKTVVLEHKKQPSSITTKKVDRNLETGMNIHEVPLPDMSVHPQKHTTSSEGCVEEGGKKYEAPYARVSSFEDQSTRNSNYAKAPNQPKFVGNGTEKAYVFYNVKKIPESKGGFRRLLKLGKRSHTSTPSVPHPHPKVNTLKSLISEDETPARKPSRRLFSFQLGGEKKV